MEIVVGRGSNSLRPKMGREEVSLPQDAFWGRLSTLPARLWAQ